jgi:hypothetical protein
LNGLYHQQEMSAKKYGEEIEFKSEDINYWVSLGENNRGGFLDVRIIDLEQHDSIDESNYWMAVDNGN